jgi:hypothetical protein
MNDPGSESRSNRSAGVDITTSPSHEGMTTSRRSGRAVAGLAGSGSIE